MMEKVLLTDICNPKQWKTIATKQLIDKGYPVFGANGIIGFYSEYTHEEPTILITCRGATCGTINISLPYSYVNGNAMALDNLSENTDIQFLKYYLESRGLNDVISGSAQPQITRQNLSKVLIPLPPLPTQKKVAAILDAADAYRQKTKALIAKYDELTQSLFLDMFGDPVTNPKGWDVKPFEKVVTNMNSLRVPIKQGDRENMRGKYPYYGATGIVDYINDFKFDGEFMLVAEDGKNLINRKKPIAWIARGQFWVNNHAHVLDENGTTNLTYLSYHLNRSDISQFVTGIDQFKMNKSNLNRIPVPVPPIDLQNQFAERIQKIEAQKAQAQQSLEKAEELFNALLQRAFKGELV